MPANVFLDTNVLIYAVAQKDPRSSRAETLLAGGGVISVQGLNEFASVAHRKMRMPWKDVVEALDAILVLCPSPVSITFEVHKAALTIAEKYRYGIYDALIAAAALHSKCKILYSEDLQHSQVIEDRLTIQNPFT